MHRLAKTSLLLALAWTALDAAPASAGTRTRDHRTETAAPATDTVASQPRRPRRRPGPRIMMPLKIDIGAQGANTTKGFLPGLELRAGIHWASLSPQPTDLDIGIGVFGAVLAGPDSGMPQADEHNDVLYGGAYLEVAQTLSRNGWGRTWASGRGEYFGRSTFGEERAGVGVAGRLSAELYASGVGIEPRGFFLGTYAVGVYVEAAARGLGSDVSPVQVSGGLTFRTPLVFTR
jgi:hypothetical protein